MDSVEEGGGVEVDDFLGEDGALIVDGAELETVLEGLHVELLEEGGFGGLDLLSLGADLEVLGDLDLTLVDLGGDVEGVEEVNLGGVETCGSGGDGEVDGSNDADSGFSGNLVSFKFGLELVDGSVGEDEGDLVLEEGGERLEFGDESAEVLLEVLELVLLNALGPHLDDLLGQGVLIDDEVGSVCSQRLSDLVDLARAHVGEVGQDDLLMVAQQLVDLLNSRSFFSSVFRSHSFNIN